jgi:hypothetical protein
LLFLFLLDCGFVLEQSMSDESMRGSISKHVHFQTFLVYVSQVTKMAVCVACSMTIQICPTVCVCVLKIHCSG